MPELTWDDIPGNWDELIGNWDDVGKFELPSSGARPDIFRVPVQAGGRPDIWRQAPRDDVLTWDEIPGNWDEILGNWDEIGVP